MLIRPTGVPPALKPLTSVSDSGRSMDRDARERSFGGRGHVNENPVEEPEEIQESAEHIIDESA